MPNVYFYIKETDKVISSLIRFAYSLDCREAEMKTIKKFVYLSVCAKVKKAFI
jgi:hypothetical protein